MLPVDCCAGVVAIIRDASTGEVERTAIRCSDHFHGIGIVHIFRRAGCLYRGDLNVLAARKGPQQRFDVRRFQQRLVALNVDVDFRMAVQGGCAHTVGAAGQRGVGQRELPAICVTEVCHFAGICGHNDAVQLRTAKRRLNNPLQHGPPQQWTQHLARQARRGNAGRDDSKNTNFVHDVVTAHFCAGRLSSKLQQVSCIPRQRTAVCAAITRAV